MTVYCPCPDWTESYPNTTGKPFAYCPWCGNGVLEGYLPPRITRWKDVAELLNQGWCVDGFDLVSPTGERRSAWGNAIKACRDRGFVK